MKSNGVASVKLSPIVCRQIEAGGWENPSAFQATGSYEAVQQGEPLIPLR
jgi:hypothetical protein